MHFTGYSAQKEFEIASKLFYGAIVEDKFVPAVTNRMFAW